MDLPVWQELREELKDKNFEVIAVACDTKGAEAAEALIRAANPQHPSLIDTQHRVPELYGTRNVPEAFGLTRMDTLFAPMIPSSLNDGLGTRKRSPSMKPTSTHCETGSRRGLLVSISRMRKAYGHV